MSTTDPILDPDQLQRLMADGGMLFDARPGEEGLTAFTRSHLVGAIHVDLNRDLSADASSPDDGGRHPLPDVEVFCRQLGEWGVTAERQIAIYDDLGGANAAARMWWLLCALGHKQVRVLDGGFSAALEAGLQTTDDRPTPKPAPPYPSSSFLSAVADHAEVELARQDPSRCVLDVRAAPRFRGETEPFDPIAGHIPGAVNLPYPENLDPRGRFKSSEELRTQYLDLLGDLEPQALIAHCGSGVTACHTLLALERAGLGGASLYVGSWSEWCRNPWPRQP